MAMARPAAMFLDPDTVICTNRWPCQSVWFIQWEMEIELSGKTIIIKKA
jgi:hypothetical protein